MRAPTAAAYVDERSVASDRSIPINVSGRGALWLKDDLDQAIERLTGRSASVKDAADVL
jgi:hypothetical protein